MSRMALVTQPAKLAGAVSWTIETRQHRGRLIAMALSPDCKLAATGGVDGSIHIWELATGKLVRVIVGHNSHILSLSWSPDGNTIASGGRGDSRIRLWDAAQRHAAASVYSAQGARGLRGLESRWNAAARRRRRKRLDLDLERAQRRDTASSLETGQDVRSHPLVSQRRASRRRRSCKAPSRSSTFERPKSFSRSTTRPRRITASAGRPTARSCSSAAPANR